MTQEFELHLNPFAKALGKRAWIVALATLLCAALTLGAALVLVRPQYCSWVTFYVHSSDGTVTSAELTASRNLVSSCIVILNTRQTLEEVAQQAGISLTYEALSEMVHSAALDDTELFRVEVTAPDPGEAEGLALAISQLLPQRIGEILQGTGIQVVDTPVAAQTPSSPDYPLLTALGALAGLIASAAWAAAKALRQEEVLTNA